MPNSPDRIDPNRPGLDPALAFAPPPDIRMPTKQIAAPAYTLVPADYYTQLAISIAAATVITSPQMALADFPLGGLVTIRRFGSGPVTLVPAAGVTLTTGSVVPRPIAVSADKTVSGVCLQRADLTTWFVFGEMVKA